MTYYLSVFCKFKNMQEREQWMMKHILPQSIPKGGPVFSWSDEDESGYRDQLDSIKSAQGYGNTHTKGT